MSVSHTEFASNDELRKAQCQIAFLESGVRSLQETAKTKSEENYALIRALLNIEKQRDKLLEAVKGCVELLKEDLECMGGCDHSVGVCVCGIKRVIDESSLLIKEIEASK